MQIIEKLNCNAEAFYDLMIQSLVQDIENATHKKVDGDTLKSGYKYHKKSAQRKGVGSEITVKIVTLKRPSDYVARFTTVIDTTDVSYHVKKDGEGCIVTYTEEYKQINVKPRPGWQVKLVEKRSKRRASKMLKQVEKYILQNGGKENA